MAHLLVIELPGGNDADIVQSAISRGDSFTFLSADLGHYCRQPRVYALLAAAHEHIEVAPFEFEEVERRVVASHRGRPFDAVLCLIDTRVIEAARLAVRLGLRFLNPASAALLRDKFSVRQRLQERGLPQPPFALADSNESLRAAVERLGLPVMIKPADGYGSQNIVALRHPEDLDPLLSPLDDLLPCGADYGLGVRANDRMVVERFMTGSFIGCDTFTSSAMHVLLGVHEKSMFEPPSFAVRGSAFTARGPQHAEIERCVFSLLDAVDFDCGAAHVELMLTDEGPRLVEINPRLVGAKIPRLLAHALERSVVCDLIELHTGEREPAISSDTSGVAVLRWIAAPEAGVLESVDLPRWSDPGVRRAEILKRPGDLVRPPMENADRLGYVMVCAPTRDEAEALADRYVSGIRIQVRAIRSAGFSAAGLYEAGVLQVGVGI